MVRPDNLDVALDRFEQHLIELTAEPPRTLLNRAGPFICPVCTVALRTFHGYRGHWSQLHWKPYQRRPDPL